MMINGKRGANRMPMKPLPIGVDDFKDLITNDYYYVDKTLFIKDLLDLKGKVNLFTRPRRFGKTLGISTVRYFFEKTGSGQEKWENQALFFRAADYAAGRTLHT